MPERDANPDARPPLVTIVMGVSGCGKSTLGRLLAERLGCAFLEGDDFHGDANVAKMASGIALDDDDRWPWLDRLGRAAGAEAARGGNAVASCSALKRAYRERIAAAAGCAVAFVCLEVAGEELDRRLVARPGHFMPASLIASQLATLELPAPDEPALRVVNDGDLATLADRVLAWLAARQRTMPMNRMLP